MKVGGSHFSASSRMTLSGTGRSRRAFWLRITGNGGSTLNDLDAAVVVGEQVNLTCLPNSTEASS